MEDGGGPFGLENLTKAFKKKECDNYEQYREWLEVDGLDLERSDIDSMNRRLKKQPGVFAKIYEQH